MHELYLDANAHIPMSENTLKIYSNYVRSRAGHGHPLAPSKPAQEASSIIEQSRARIAALLGCSSNQIVFTSSCTQACEWATLILNKLNTKIYLSPIEHSAVRQAVEKYIPNHEFMNVNAGGTCFGNYKYAACLHVQNEIGTIQPLESFDSEFLFSDMCQSVGKTSICLRDMPVNLATFGAHKFGGPAGVGILYIKNYKDYIDFGAGSKYFNDRPGTPDVASIIATAAALEETLFNMNENLQRMKLFQKTLEDKLINMNLEIIGINENRVPNTTYVKIPGLAFPLLAYLSERGIYVGLGSACGSMHTGPSQTMTAIGQDCDAHDYLRISQHGNYSDKEANIVADEIYKYLKGKS